MSFLLGGLIAGGLGLAGSLIGTAVNANENKKNREFSAAEAQKQRDWETQMSNTAYQRGTEDMIKAGVNPAMAYSGGASGASTPHGAAAQSSGSSSTAFDMINSAANLAAAFNYDKNKHNDVNLKQISKATAYIQRNGYKNIEELNKSFFTDLNKVKI